MNSQASNEPLVIAKLAQLLQLAPDAIGPGDSVFALGLDSSGALSLMGHLEDTLEISIDPAMMWEYPHISDLSAQLAQLYQGQRPESL